MMKNTELIFCEAADDLARKAAGAWLDEIAAAGRAGAAHSVALSGGRITKSFFASVVEQQKQRTVPLNEVHFFWADERCVPPTDHESNFRMARELLFEPLQIAGDRIHRVRGEDGPDAAARGAEEEIRRVVPPEGAGLPVLDLVFLGLGEDGHVASLFPGHSEDPGARVAYRAVRNSPKPPPDRVTLTYAALAAARQVWMLASGAGKESALRESLSPGGKTPFGRVLQLRKSTRIFTDISLG